MKLLQNNSRIIVPVLSFFIIQLSIHTSPIKAQVNVQDSLALIEMYETMDGPNWTHHEGWGTNPLLPYPGWYGVTVVLNRVTQLNLNANNLSGCIPPSFCNLSALNYAALGGNNITSIPDSIGQLQSLWYLTLAYNMLTSVPSSIGNLNLMASLGLSNNLLTGIIPDTLLKLDPGVMMLFLGNNQFDSLPPPVPGITPVGFLCVYGNRLHFDDIEAWMSYPFYPASDFEYSPQDSVSNTLDTIIMPGSNITFTSKVGGSANTYKWYHNGNLLSTGPSPDLALYNVNSSHSGNYWCVITNSLVPNLTLYRRHIFLTVDPSVDTPEIEEPAHDEPEITWNRPSQTLIIHVSTPQVDQCRLQVFDLQGKLLQTMIPAGSPAQNVFTLDCSSLPAGIYLVKLATSSGAWSRKICIF